MKMLQHSATKWLLIYALSGCFLYWAWNAPLFWWLCDARLLYAPLYSRPFDPYTKGVFAEGELEERFATEHCVMLSFDERAVDGDMLRAMQGRFLLEIWSGKGERQQWDIRLHPQMITRINRWNGAEKWLQTFDLPPHGGKGEVRFRLTVLEPVTFPNGTRPPACCSVRVVYQL